MASNPKYSFRFVLLAAIIAAVVGAGVAYLALRPTGQGEDSRRSVPRPDEEPPEGEPDAAPDAGVADAMSDAAGDAADLAPYEVPGGLRVQVIDIRGRPAQGAWVSTAGSGVWPPQRDGTFMLKTKPCTACFTSL